MRSAEPDQPVSSRSKWTIDVRATVQFAAAFVLILAVAVLLHRTSTPTTTQPIVRGSIQATRIVPDHAVETGWGGQPTWKAEYSVAYLVANREYAIWADSGIRGESDAEVRLALPKSLPACRVRYNSSKPEESVAECK
jgi:hypothetical protein